MELVPNTAINAKNKIMTMNLEEKDLDNYELIIKDGVGVFAISMVDAPATGEEFTMFSNELQFSSIDEEQQLILGMILQPEQRIYRRTEDGYEYTVSFKAETIKDVAHNYLINNNQSEVTLQHKEKTDNVTLVETWTVADSELDKSVAFGKSYPVGTWLGIMKVQDKELWDSFKDSNMKGFSIEGLFDTVEVKYEAELEAMLDTILKNITK